MGFDLHHGSYFIDPEYDGFMHSGWRWAPFLKFDINIHSQRPCTPSSFLFNIRLEYQTHSLGAVKSLHLFITNNADKLELQYENANVYKLTYNSNDIIFLKPSNKRWNHINLFIDEDKSLDITFRRTKRWMLLREYLEILLDSNTLTGVNIPYFPLPSMPIISINNPEEFSELETHTSISLFVSLVMRLAMKMAYSPFPSNGP